MNQKRITEFLKIILFIAGAICASILASKVTSNMSTIETSILTRELITFLLVTGLFILLTLFWDRIDLKESVLLKENKKLFSVSKGFLLGASLIGTTTIILLLSGWISIQPLSKNKFAFALPFFTMFFTAFWEELVFRGYALNKLQYITGKHTAAIAVALIFALLHLLSPLKSPAIVISTLFSGLLLNYAFLKGKSLYFPIGIHFAWNAFNSLLYGKAFFEVEYHNQLMAGVKNPEQGIVGITITALGFVYILFMRK